MRKSYIWSLPTRTFHGTFAILMTICLLTDDDLLTIHIIAGYLLLVPFTFRIGWGIFGPKYSKFKDFPVSIKKTKEFMLNVFNTEQKYIGHNPSASIVMLSMLILVPFIIFSGMLTLGAEKSKGLFSNLGKNGLYEDIHELTANIMYFLVFAHLVGIAVDRLIHKEHGTLESIIKGYKNTKIKESIKINIFQKLFAFVFLVLFLIFSIYLIFNSNNPFVS